MEVLRKNPLILLPFGLLVFPFALFALGYLDIMMFVAAFSLALYAALFMLSFEAGFLILVFFRSSLDYVSIMTGGAFNPAALVTVAIIVLSLFYVLYRRANVFRYEETLPFILFLLVTVIPFGVSRDLFLSLSDWLRVLSTLSVYVLTRLLAQTEAQIRRYFYVILTSSLIPLGMAAYQFATNSGIVDVFGQGRLNGTFSHPNAFSTYLLILLVFCIAQLLERKTLVSRALLGGLVLAASAIFVLTYSRGAWIVFVVSCVFMGVVRHRKLLLLLPAALVILVIAVPSVAERFRDVIDPSPITSQDKSALTWRENTWGSVIPMFWKRPIFGNGFSMVEYEFGVLTHNDYLRLLAETGVVGLLAYLHLILRLLVKTVKDYRLSRGILARSFNLGLLAVIVGVLVRQSADNTIRHTVVLIYFWTFAALARNLTLLDRGEKPAGEGGTA